LLNGSLQLATDLETDSLACGQIETLTSARIATLAGLTLTDVELAVAENLVGLAAGNTAADLFKDRLDDFSSLLLGQTLLLRDLVDKICAAQLVTVALSSAFLCCPSHDRLLMR